MKVKYVRLLSTIGERLSLVQLAIMLVSMLLFAYGYLNYNIFRTGQYFNLPLIFLLSIVVFYIVAEWMIPCVLYRNRLMLFVFLLIMLCIGATVLIVFLADWTNVLRGMPHLNVNEDFRNIKSGGYFASMAFACGSSCLGVLFYDQKKAEKLLFAIEKEKINTELNFLRSQVNPHFLFNILNILYFKIKKENTEARNTLELISDILRYQLYESRKDKICIEKELEYLNYYVSLIPVGEQKITLRADKDIAGFYILPMLLLHTVEAGILLARGKPIDLLLIRNKEAELTIIIDINKNNSSGSTPDLANVEKRLKLFYPDYVELTQTEHVLQPTITLRLNNAN